MLLTVRVCEHTCSPVCECMLPAFYTEVRRLSDNLLVPCTDAYGLSHAGCLQPVWTILDGWLLPHEL